MYYDALPSIKIFLDQERLSFSEVERTSLKHIWWAHKPRQSPMSSFCSAHPRGAMSLCLHPPRARYRQPGTTYRPELTEIAPTSQPKLFPQPSLFFPIETLVEALAYSFLSTVKLSACWPPKCLSHVVLHDVVRLLLVEPVSVINVFSQAVSYCHTWMTIT